MTMKGHKHTQEWKLMISNKLKESYKSGKRVSWNKGLTKDTDKRIKSHSEKLSENALTNPNYGNNGNHKKFPIELYPNMGNRNKVCSEETKKKMSEKAKLNRLLGVNTFIPSHKGFKHSEEHKRLHSEKLKKLWSNQEFAHKVLSSWMKRPNSYEEKISSILIKYNLPFIYTGNGTFLIGHKNPDFVNKDKKIAIEVYHRYFKEFNHGTCENYETERINYFNKFGRKVIFIRDEEVDVKDWESICLNKIRNFK